MLDLNTTFVFNWLSLVKDINIEKEKALKSQQQTYKIR